MLAIFMNNLLSYCGLVDTRISASEKDLPAVECFGKCYLNFDKKKTTNFFQIYLPF